MRARASRGLLGVTLLFGIGFLWLLVTALLTARMLGPSIAGARLPLLAWGLAAAAYLGAHLARIARLALIAGDARLSLRMLTSVNLFANGLTLAIPFKLGEIYRVAALSLVVGGVARGIILVWTERVFDAAMLLALLCLALVVAPDQIAAYGAVLAVALLFVVATIVLVAVMPDNLRRAGSYIIRRYDAEWTIVALRAINEFRRRISESMRMLRGRYASLGAFTVLIWLLEGLSFAIVASSQSATFQPLLGLLEFLSSTTTGATLATRLAGGETLSSMALSYLLATQVPLIAVALAASLYLFGRLVGRWSAARHRPMVAA